MQHDQIYRSILHQLSHLPADYLGQVEAYLQKLTQEILQKETIRLKNKAFAGAWSDLSEEDFQALRAEIKHTGENLANREVEL